MFCWDVLSYIFTKKHFPLSYTPITTNRRKHELLVIVKEYGTGIHDKTEFLFF